MKSRRSRWILATTVAIAMCASLMSLPSMTPLAFSNVAPKAVYSAGAPPAHASWQATLMSGGW